MAARGHSAHFLTVAEASIVTRRIIPEMRDRRRILVTRIHRAGHAIVERCWLATDASGFRVTGFVTVAKEPVVTRQYIQSNHAVAIDAGISH